MHNLLMHFGIKKYFFNEKLNQSTFLSTCTLDSCPLVLSFCLCPGLPCLPVSWIILTTVCFLPFACSWLLLWIILNKAAFGSFTKSQSSFVTIVHCFATGQKHSVMHVQNNSKYKKVNKNILKMGKFDFQTSFDFNAFIPISANIHCTKMQYNWYKFPITKSKDCFTHSATKHSILWMET